MKAGLSIYIKKICLVTCCFLVSSTSLFSQEDITYDFLNVTTSARIYGLGGINISTVEDNIEVADQNPALLGPEMGGWIDVNYMRYIGDSNFAGLKYGQGIGQHGAWLAGLQYYGYGSIPETDETGAVLGKFAPMDMAVSGSISYDLFTRVRIGATVKFLYSSYADFNALALASDLGINYFDPDRDLSLSLVGANLGGQLKKFNNVSEKLPMDLRLGITWGLSNIPIRFSVTAWNLVRWNDKNKNLINHFVFGLDFVPSSKFYLSLGYNNRVRTLTQGFRRNLFSGFAVGAGFSTSRFNIAAALSQPYNGTLTFMINLGLKLQDLIK